VLLQVTHHGSDPLRLWLGHFAWHIVCGDGGIHLRRDSWVSVRYAEGLNATTSSVTLQRTDRQGIVGQKPTYGPMSL
jgi:hypothetical protein